MTNKAAAAVIAADTIQGVPLALIREWGENPRGKMDRAGLQELAESIKKDGVLQPVVLRPRGETYDLVFGHRRVAAAKMAGLDVVPARLRADMTDEQVMAARIVENLQRQDLPPLDEAAGFRALREKHKLSWDEVAARVGKNKVYVYMRDRLLDLPDKMKDALRAGKVEVGTAALVLRVSDAKEREAAADLILNGRGYGPKEPLPFNEAKREIGDRFFLVLSRAPFDVKDATLVPAAGTCAACPKRTGNQQDLFGTSITPDDRCTDASCFGAKRTAAFARTVEKDVKRGVQVLPDAERKKVFKYGDHHVDSSSGYVVMDSECWQDPKRRSYRALLAKSDVPTFVTQGGEGPVYLVRAADARKALVKAGVKLYDQERGAGGAAAAARARAQAEATRTKTQAEDRAQAEAVKYLSTHAWTDKDFAWIVGVSVRSLWAEVAKEVAVRRGLLVGAKKPQYGGHDYPGQLAKAAETMKGGELRGLLADVLLQGTRGFGRFRSGPGLSFSTIVKQYGVNLDKLVRQVKAEKKAKAAKPKPKAKGRTAARRPAAAAAS